MIFARTAVSCLGLGAVAMMSVSACSSSSKSGGASSSSPPPTSSSASTTASTPAAAPSTSASSSAPIAAANAKACADVRGIATLNQEFNAAGSDLKKGQKLLGSLVSTADSFAKDAPKAVSGPAKEFAKDARVLAVAAAKAKTITQLNTEAKTDPKLKAAGAGLQTSGTAVGTWAQKACGAS